MNDITTLRNHLFETLEALKDKDNPMDLERAKTVSDIAQTIINSAKVEVELIRHTGNYNNTEFIPTLGKPAPPEKQLSETPTGIKIVEGGRTVHKLK